jgi:predicted metalloprotease with PDZ domain
VNVAGLTVSANGKAIPWRRDDTEMYAIHVQAPGGTKRLDVSLDFLLSGEEEGFTSGASSSANLAVLNWNQVLLYPTGVPMEDVTCAAAIKLPAGWKYGTALPVARESGGWVEFKPAPLVTLIDSPVNAGRYFRAILLAPEVSPRHVLDLAADSREAIDMPREEEEHYGQLVREGLALFGAHHYREYHFLYTLSDHVPFFGLEHHESSDNRAKERSLIDEDQRLRTADLLPHEFAHSWNGKYRRPADLATPNYQVPMKTDLLWVYEGLTQYLGWVLAARSGLLTTEQARDYLAVTAADLENEPGRTWRPLLDTAVSAQILYGSETAWSGWRRGVDFYDESLLFWLEADAIIRGETKGAKSLDDFCRRFHGGPSGTPTVKPYTFDEVVATMNDVAPYPWRKFFSERVEQVRPQRIAWLGAVASCT